MALITHILLVDCHSSVTFRLLGLMILFFLSVSVHNKQVLADEGKDMCQFTKYTKEKPDSVAEARRRLAPLIGKKYESYDGVEYKFTIGICTTVGDSPGVAVVQSKLENGQPTTPYNIGNLTNTHIVAGTDWIMLEYKGGEKYNSHCGGEEKRSVIMITCDDNKSNSDEAQMIYLGEENEKQEGCYYLFEMKHQAVCQGYSEARSLSVGTILVIVFFSVVAVYLIVGFLYTRFVLKSKGVEQIPNYEFWKDFCNLQADGCNLICRSKGRQRANHFGGIGDEQLEPSETIQDDHLLPM